eukprot:XP_008646679.1 uncharacterized protein LOC103628209 [Zea mays]
MGCSSSRQQLGALRSSRLACRQVARRQAGLVTTNAMLDRSVSCRAQLDGSPKAGGTGQQQPAETGAAAAGPPWTMTGGGPRLDAGAAPYGGCMPLASKARVRRPPAPAAGAAAPSLGLGPGGGCGPQPCLTGGWAAPAWYRRAARPSGGRGLQSRPWHADPDPDGGDQPWRHPWLLWCGRSGHGGTGGPRWCAAAWVRPATARREHGSGHAGLCAGNGPAAQA